MIRAKIKLQPSSKKDRSMHNTFVNLPMPPFNGLLLNIYGTRLKVVDVIVDIKYSEVNINTTEVIIVCE